MLTADFQGIAGALGQAAQGVALVVYGVVIAWAIAGGAWFGRVGWPCTTAGLLRRLGTGGRVAA